MQGALVFAIAGEKNSLQRKKECLMRNLLADENTEEIPGVKGLVEAIEQFEIKTGWHLGGFRI